MTRNYTHTMKIGRTEYVVTASFDETAAETFEDKLLKIIEREMHHLDHSDSDESKHDDDSSAA